LSESVYNQGIVLQSTVDSCCSNSGPSLLEWYVVSTETTLICVNWISV